MFKKIIIIAIIFISHDLNSQRHLFYETKDHYKDIYFYIGTSKTNFLNSRFVKNESNDKLNWTPGISFGYSIVNYPVVIELGYFSNSYIVKNHNWEYSDDTKLTHRGFDCGINVMLLPQIKLIQPFVGLGYNNAAIGVGLFSSEKDKIQVSSVGVSAVTFDFGVNVSVSRRFKIQAEYDRSVFGIEDKKAFGRLSIVLLYGMNWKF